MTDLIIKARGDMRIRTENENRFFRFTHANDSFAIPRGFVPLLAKIGIGLSVVTWIGASVSFCAEATFIGRVPVSATATDLSEQTSAQENGTPQNRLGGHGSGICWLGDGNRYAMLPDRGPEDGATSYKCRMHIVEIKAEPGNATPVSVKLLETHLLTTASGECFVGRASQFDREHPERSLRLDPEGIRATDHKTVLISDEYGPSIREFDLTGKWVRDLPTPKRYRIAVPGNTPEEELPPHNRAGRQNNRGWEGVALSTDGQKIYCMTQSPLIQDGALDEKNARIGTNIRIWEYDLTTKATREYLYALEDKSHGCNDLESIAPNRLLVIERDSKAAEAAKFKRIYEIDLTDASDISSLDSLPTNGVPTNIKPVSKKLFLDLLVPEFGLAGKAFPDKIEGIALGPQLKNGGRVFIVTSDNDFKSDEPTEIFTFGLKP